MGYQASDLVDRMFMIEGKLCSKAGVLIHERQAFGKGKLP
jgi:hypothetical protein